MSDEPKRRVGQISITVNGECLAGGGFRQHLFELSGGPATDAPFPYSQRPSVAEVYAAALAWLNERMSEIGAVALADEGAPE